MRSGFVSFLLVASVSSFGHLALARTNSLTTIPFAEELDLNDSKGMTFFNFLKSVVDPKIDKIAKDGFVVADAKTATHNLELTNAKVQRNAFQAAGSEEQFDRVMDALAGQKLNYQQIPEALKKAGVRLASPPWKIGNFVALASGGGVAVKISENNFAYNCGYEAGDEKTDPQSGRTYIESVHNEQGKKLGLANDASDAELLRSLEALAKSGEDLRPFFQTLLDIHTNSDSSGYSELSPKAQATLSEVIGVGIAEGDRHLMTDLRAYAWDNALLEVAMLTAFHAGQDDLMVMYGGKLVDKTPVQQKTPTSGQPANRPMQKASMLDWWQFSTQPGSARSGINLTKRDFRLLGSKISQFEREKHSDLVSKVESHFKNSKGVKLGGNVLAEFTDYLINFDTPVRLKDAKELATDMTEFLMQVKTDANDINNWILSKQM